MDTESENDLAEKLYKACKEGNVKDVQALLKRGAPPNCDWYRSAKPIRGSTPLHAASRNNYPFIVKILIQWGADLDASDEYGRTALYLASSEGHQNCAEELLKNGCQKDMKDNFGTTAEDEAKRQRTIRHMAVASYLGSYEAPRKDPLSSFPSVKQFQSLQVEKWYELGRQLRVSEATLDGLKNDQNPTAATLLAAKIRKPSMRWKTIVEGLLSVGDYNVAKTVCEEHALGGHSPLSVAVYYGWLNWLRFLVETEALDPNVTATGETMVSLAESRGMSEVLKYLNDISGSDDSASTTADVDEQQLKYSQRLDELIQRKKKSTVLQYLKLYFIGSAGLGKTTTRKRMTGAIVNISKMSPEERIRCSTYLAECTQVLAIVDHSDASKLLFKSSENLDEEAQLLFAYLYGSKSSEADSTTSESRTDASPTSPDQALQQDDADTTQQDEHSSQTEKQLQRTHTDSDVTSSTQDEQMQQTKQHEQTSTKDGEVKQKPSYVKVNVGQVITRLRCIVGSGKYAEEILGKILLNLVDVGGQPGFLEMLPFLSKGPGIFLAFFPLDKDLNEYCEVSYERGDDKITPYKATYTNRETLSKILSSVSYHSSLDNKELAEKLGHFSDVKPVATLVGTFKDRLETQVKAELLLQKLSKEFPKATQEDIEKVVRPTLSGDQVAKQQSEVTARLKSTIEHHLSSEPFKQEVKDRLKQALEEKNEALQSIAVNFEELLSYPSGDKCFIAVDNYTGTDSDIDLLRKHLQDVFSSHFKDAKIPIQPSQLLLGIVLRKEYDIVSMEDCIQIGRALNMDEEDVRFTVWFLDYSVGALIFHPDIDDDWFKENIICSPQVVFDSTSALIVESLMETHSPKASSKFTAAERKNWAEKGQFSLDTVKRCHSDENEKKVQEEKLIPVEKLIMLLEHSNLLAQIVVKEKVGGKEKVKTMCFIPSILDCATPEELTKAPPPDIDTPTPVKLTFEPRYVPIGVFCAMISRLVSRGREGILGMKWELADSSVKRNLVTFRVEKHIVALVAHVECIEIRVIRQKRRIPLHEFCAYVLSAVIYIMKEINRLVCPIISFDCACGHHQSRHTSALCLLCPGVTPCFECEKGEVSLTPQQQCWFAKEVKPNSSAMVKALQYAKRADLQGLSFEWSMDGSEISIGNELILDDVTEEDCEGYFTCEILKNGKPFFNVYRCLKVAGEVEVSANERLLCEVRETLWNIRSDWYSLAVELNIDFGTRKSIEANYRLLGGDVCFNVMTKHFVDRASSSNQARVALAITLKSPVIGRMDLARKFECVTDDKESSVDMSKESLSGPLDVDKHLKTVRAATCINAGPLDVDKHLKTVRAATWEVRAKWKDLAVELDITEGDRDMIEYNHPNHAGACYTALLEKWLTRSSPPPMWGSLIKALQSPTFKRVDIADQIKAMLGLTNSS